MLPKGAEMKIQERGMRKSAKGMVVLSAGLLAAAVAGLAGCAGGGQVERWHMTESREPQAAEAIANAPVQPVAVVFYRQVVDQARAGDPVNLYINGQYQASLVGNTYTEQSLCPGQHDLTSAFNDVTNRYETKRVAHHVQIGSEPKQYFRVSEDSAGHTVIEPVQTGAAEETVSSLRLLQTHTIPRVVRRGCAPA